MRGVGGGSIPNQIEIILNFFSAGDEEFGVQSRRRLPKVAARRRSGPWRADGGCEHGPAATFYLIVEGNFVPAPASLALVGMDGLVTMRRRRD